MSTPLPPLPPNPADWLDHYLDGLLSDADRARFEREIERDPQLRRAVELQSRVDGTLKAAFPYTAPNLVAGRIGDEARATSATRRIPIARLRMYAAAAVVLLCAGIWSLYANWPGPDIRYLDPTTVYQRLETIGFVPQFKCENDSEFIAAVHKRLGAGLLVTSTQGMEVLGWAYGNDYTGRIIGPDTMVLMCKLDSGEHVVVLMDRKKDDRKLELPEGSKLHLFRREVGSLVLYEITPLADQHVLPVAQPANIPKGG